LVDIMLTIINKQKFFNTLHKMFNPKIIGIDIIDPTILQGNVFSLLLYNFYLHKYNEKILHLRFELEKGSNWKKWEMKLYQNMTQLNKQRHRKFSSLLSDIHKNNTMYIYSCTCTQLFFKVMSLQVGISWSFIIALSLFGEFHYQ